MVLIFLVYFNLEIHKYLRTCIHTHVHIYTKLCIPTNMHTYIQTDRGTDRQTMYTFHTLQTLHALYTYTHYIHYITLHYVHTYRHVTFPVFAGISVFSIFFAEKSISEIQVKMRRKLSGGGTYYLHCFIK